jgi:hypothetical protein
VLATGAEAGVDSTGAAAGAVVSLVNGFLYSRCGVITSIDVGLYSLLLADGAAEAAGWAARLPRARPEPRLEPKEPVGAGVVVGVERGSRGASAGAPDDAVSDMVVCVFVTGALNAKREHPDG